MDPYAALMGAPTTEEEQRQLASILRGQAATGGRLSTSTIAPVAKQGAAMQQRASDQAAGIGLARYREKMLESQEADRQARLLMSAMSARAKEGKGKDYYKLSDTAAKRFEDQIAIAGTVKALSDEFQDDFAGTIPFFGEVEDFLANKGIATSGMRKQAQWWGDWRKHYENIERNRLFGSALTESEQRAWKASNITPDMSPQDIKARLKTLNKLSSKMAAYAANNLKNRNIDPDYIYGVTDAYGILPEDAMDYEAQLSNPDYSVVGAYTRGDLSTLSDEELQALRARLGGQ